MKKAVFFFDTFLLKKDEDYYGMTLTYDFLTGRYLKYYDELTVSTRVKDSEEEKGNYEGYKKVNGKNIKVNPIMNYKKISDGILKKKVIIKEIEKVIEGKDVVIIRLPSMIGNLACGVCKKKKIKYLIEMVACAWDGYNNHVNIAGKIIAPYMFFQTRKRVKNAPKVLYVTEKFLQKRYPTKGYQIACSDVILQKQEDKILQNRLLKIDNMKINKVNLCTVANVGLKYKGHKYVFKALRLINNRTNIKFEYYLAGNGDNSKLKKLAKKYNIEENVKFLGSINHDKVFELFDKIDIYIQPSLQEGLPRALLEAMSRACPCIGSTAGGIPELLSKKSIFKKKDYKKLVKLLLTINNNTLKEEAKHNFEQIKNFNIKKLEEKRKSFYSIV